MGKLSLQLALLSVMIAGPVCADIVHLQTGKLEGTVIERKDGPGGPVLRVVTVLGREGWIKERCTEKWEVK